MIDFLLFSTLVILASCEARIMYVTEGDEVKIDFLYPCNSSRVTLQYGNRAPCYSSVDPETLSMPPNQELKVKNGTDVCSLHLTIDPVLRNDAGTYIMTVYEDGEYSEDARIGLRVDYPPGKASCDLNNDYNYDGWVSLRCTAPRGTLPGQIVCYQGGQRLPPFKNPEQTDSRITQVVLARSKDVVFCCSSSTERTTSECECDDFARDLTNKAAPPGLINPCPTPLPLSSQDPTISPPKDDLQMKTPNSTPPKAVPPTTTHTHDVIDCSSHWEGVLAIILIYINILLNAWLFFKVWKIEKGLRNRADLDTANVLQNLKALVKEKDDDM